jgi:hypothetical protein
MAKDFINYYKETENPSGDLVLKSRIASTQKIDWHIIPIDCNSENGGHSGPVTLTMSIDGANPVVQTTTVYFISSDDLYIFAPEIPYVEGQTWNDWVTEANANFGWLGTWSVLNNELKLEMACHIANFLVPNKQISLAILIA